MAEMIPFDGSEDKENTRPSEQESTVDPAPSPVDARRYSNEEVSEIIRVALRNLENTQTDSVDHAEMLAIGRDFGLGPEDIARAFNDIDRNRGEDDLQSQMMLAFKLHLGTFAIVMTGLFALNVATGTNQWWIQYPLIAWGMVLVGHGILNRFIPRLSQVILDRTGKTVMDSFGYETSGTVSSTSLSFSIPDVIHGLAETKGLLQLRDDHLLIECQTQDTVFGVLKSDVKEIVVPYEDIASVRLVRQFWVTKLILQSHRLKTFEQFRGQEGGRVTLVLDKNAREASERLARELASRIG